MYTAGSDADFDRLYRDCYHRILYTLLGVLGDLAAAEDCTQEAFLRAYRAWDTWRPDAPAEAWLHRIALNVAFSHRHWQKLRRLSELVTRLGQPRSPEIDAPDLDADLWRALRRLPPRQAAIVVLRHHHGYTSREIAAALGVPESTVGSRLAAAKARLRQELGDVSPDDAVPVACAVERAR